MTYEQIEQKMAEEKITAYRLCKDTGVSLSTFWRFKNSKNKNNPNKKTMLKITNYLGL